MEQSRQILPEVIDVGMCDPSFSNRSTYTLDLCQEENRGRNFLIDRTEFVLHVSDMSEIINVEASTDPGIPQGGWTKTIFDLGVKQMFYAATLRLDFIFLIDIYHIRLLDHGL